MVIRTMTGNDVPEPTLRVQSNWHPPGPAAGTTANGLRNALQANGVPTAAVTNTNLNGVAASTDANHPTIVLLGPQNPGGPNHWVVVDRVETAADGTRQVTTRDPWPVNVGARTTYNETQFNNRFTGVAVTTN
jgi:hypothetical protein